MEQLTQHRWPPYLYPPPTLKLKAGLNPLMNFPSQTELSIWNTRPQITKVGMNLRSNYSSRTQYFKYAQSEKMSKMGRTWFLKALRVIPQSSFQLENHWILSGKLTRFETNITTLDWEHTCSSPHPPSDDSSRFKRNNRQQQLSKLILR